MLLIPNIYCPLLTCLHMQVKAFLRGESPPFSAGQLEGMASFINSHARVVRKLCNTSLRYWIIEFLRRQPKEKRYCALILRFIKDRNAALLLVEVGIVSLYSFPDVVCSLHCVNSCETING